MGILSRFRKKPQLPDNEVIVPDHAKDPNAAAASEYQEAQEETQQPEEPISPLETRNPKRSYFRVNGSYDMGKQLMLSGVVEQGKLVKGMKCKLVETKNELTITDIKVSSETVGDLMGGEEGTLFLKYKDFPNVKYDTLLEFK